MLELISRQGLNEALESKENKIYYLTQDEYSTLKSNGYLYRDDEVITYNEDDYYAVDGDDGESDSSALLSDYYTKIEIDDNFYRKSEIDTQYETLFTSVSNGKINIADAITDKGVATSATDSFSTMATNIRNIQTGSKGGDTIVESGYDLIIIGTVCSDIGYDSVEVQ